MAHAGKFQSSQDFEQPQQWSTYHTYQLPRILLDKWWLRNSLHLRRRFLVLSPLVMVAHRNRLQQGTMRGLGQVLKCQMNFSLNSQSAKWTSGWIRSSKIFWPKAICWCTFPSQPCSHLHGMPTSRIDRWGHCLPTLGNQCQRYQWLNQNAFQYTFETNVQGEPPMLWFTTQFKA